MFVKPTRSKQLVHVTTISKSNNSERVAACNLYSHVYSLSCHVGKAH